MLSKRHYWYHISQSLELSHSSVLLPYSPTLKCKQSEVLGLPWCVGNFFEFWDSVFFSSLMCFSDKLNFDDSVINRVTEKSRQKEADM